MATARSALIVRQGELSAEDASRVSLASLDRPLEGDAELAVMAVTTGATVLGAFQRHHGALPSPPIVRRISGGAFVRVDRGTLHVVLALARPAALVACDARHIVNRYVRPLLRALTKSGALAHYFGRDWVSVAKRPVGQVGFAHDSRTGRAVFEAFVAVTHAFAPAGRASFLGKEPATLEAVTGAPYVEQDKPVLGATSTVHAGMLPLAAGTEPACAAVNGVSGVDRAPTAVVPA